MSNPNSVFLVTSAGGAGLTKSPARSPRFEAPSRGVRYPRDEPDVLDALTAAALITKPDV